MIYVIFQFSNSYIKSHYNGGYKPKMTIDYNREDIAINKVEMTYCQRIKAAVRNFNCYQFEIFDSDMILFFF